MLVAGFLELAGDVGEAGYGGDGEFRMAVDEGAVGAQAVALEVAAEGCFPIPADEDVVQAGVGAAFVPVEEHSVFFMMIDPEVPRRGLARAGLQTSHRGFIDLDVVGLAQAGGNELIERLQPVGEVVVPGAHEVAGELDAMGGLELPLLAVKGAVVAELLGEQVGSERGGEHAAGQQAGCERRGERDGIDLVFTHVGETFDDLQGEGGGLDVETLADFLTSQAEVVGGGKHFGMNDLAHDGGQSFERLAELAYAAGAGLWLCWHLGFSRRSLVFGSGGGGLFCLVSEELQQKLFVTHLLAPGSVDALEQCRDDALLDGEFGFQ